MKSKMGTAAHISEEILDSIIEGVMILDDTIIKQANGSIEHILGIKQKEYINKSILDFAVNKEKLRINIDNVTKKGIPIRFETRLLKRSQKFYASISFTRSKSKKNNIVCVIRDISERKKSSQELRKRLDYATTISLISSRFADSEFNYALSASLADLGRISRSSRVFLHCRIVDDLIIEEWCQNEYDTLLDKLQYPVEDLRYIYRRLSGGRCAHLNLSKLPSSAKTEKGLIRTLGCKKVSFLPLRADKRLIGYISFSDIEFSKDLRALASTCTRIISNQIFQNHINKALALAKSSFHHIVERNRDGILIVDTQDRVLYSNNTAERYLKKTPKISREDKEIRIDLDGKEGTGEIVFSPTQWHGTDANLIMIRDITERKKIEQDLKNAYSELKELDNAKSVFLNLVSHELNTPLTNITAHLEILSESKHKPDEKCLFSLQAIKRNSCRLRMLVDNILEISRIECNKFKLNKEKIKIKELIGQITDSLKVLAERQGVKLKVKVNDDTEITTDKKRTSHALKNIINNAIKFTEDGTITITEKKKGDKIHITIKDTGIGIPKENLGSLFTNFNQDESIMTRKYEGAGLGLGLAKHIIEKQGGEITVKSIEGKGSEFSVLLPL